MKRQLCIGLLALGFCGNAAAQEVLAPLPQALTDMADIATLSGLTNDLTLNGGPALTAATEPTSVLPSEDLGDVVDYLETQSEVLPDYADYVEQTLNTLVHQLLENTLLETALEDLNIIVGNLENVPEAAIDGREFRDVHGNPVASETGLRDAAIELLKGNLVTSRPHDGFGPLGPSATSSTLLALAATTDALVADTSHDSDFTPETFSPLTLVGVDVSNTILFGTFLIDGPAAELEPVEEDLHPLFEGAETLTLPVIDILEDL